MNDKSNRVSITVKVPSEKRTKIHIRGKSTGYIKSMDNDNTVEQTLNIEKLKLDDNSKNVNTNIANNGLFGRRDSQDKKPYGLGTRSMSLNASITKDHNAEANRNKHRWQPPTISPRQPEFISSPKEHPVEVHQAKFRCQPVHQPVHTQTAKLQRSRSFMADSRTNKEKDDDVFENNSDSSHKNGFTNKRYGSFKLPNNNSTQEKLDFLNKASQIRAYLSMRRKNLDDGKSGFTTENGLEMKKEIKVQRNFQYPTQRCVTPKMHRRPTYGYTSSVSSTSSSTCASPTFSEGDDEREKLFLFTKALEKAVMQKREIYK